MPSNLLGCESIILLFRAVLIFSPIKLVKLTVFFCKKYIQMECMHVYMVNLFGMIRHHKNKGRVYKVPFAKSKSHAVHMVNCVYSSSITIVMGLPSVLPNQATYILLHQIQKNHPKQYCNFMSYDTNGIN